MTNFDSHSFFKSVKKSGVAHQIRLVSHPANLHTHFVLNSPRFNVIDLKVGGSLPNVIQSVSHLPGAWQEHGTVNKHGTAQ